MGTFEELISKFSLSDDDTGLSPKDTAMPKTSAAWDVFLGGRFVNIAMQEAIEVINRSSEEQLSKYTPESDHFSEVTKVDMIERAQRQFCTLIAHEIGAEEEQIFNLTFGRALPSADEILALGKNIEFIPEIFEKIHTQLQDITNERINFLAQYNDAMKDLIRSNKLERFYIQCLHEVFQLGDVRTFDKNTSSLIKFSNTLELKLPGILPIEPLEQSISEQFLLSPDWQDAFKNRSKAVLACLKLWHQKKIQDAGTIQDAFMQSMLGIDLALFTADCFHDTSLLDVAHHVLGKDANPKLLETLMLISPRDGTALDYLEPVQLLMNKLKGTPAEATFTQLLGRTKPSLRLPILEELAYEPAAQTFLLDTIQALPAYEYRGIDLSDKVEFWLQYSNEPWQHDVTRTMFDTIKSRAHGLGTLEYQRLANYCSRVLSHEQASTFETILMHKKNALSIIETYLSYAEPNKASLFLAVALHENQNIKAEQIAKKLDDIPTEELDGIIAEENLVKAFWSYKKPKEIASPASVTPKIVAQLPTPAPSSPVIMPKGRPWIEILSEALPEYTEEIEFIVESIGEPALKTLAKHFDEQQAVSIALALALLHDSNPHLGKIILGQKNYIKQFGDFVITSDPQRIEDFKEASNIVSNLHALVMKTLSPNASQQAKQEYSLSHVLLDALPHKVDVVQFVSNALPREVLQVAHEATDSAPQCFYFNPSLNLGTLNSEQVSKIIIIEEDLLKTSILTPNNQTIVIPVTNLSLENVATLKASVLNKIAAFDGRSMVQEKIALPEDRAKQVKDSWKKLSREHQKTFLNYLERLVRDGSCGTMKGLVSKPSEFISVRILTPGGPRLYLVEGRGEFQGQYMIVGIGNKDSQTADLKALDTIQLDGLFTRPHRSSADIFGE